MSTLNRGIQGEIWRLADQGLIDPPRAQRLAEQYPVEPWDVLRLVRWLTWLGALTAGAGAVVLGGQLASWLRLCEVGLALTAAAGFFVGHRVLPRRGLPRTGAALELLGAMGLQGFLTALAVDFSSGSGDWPLLFGICAGVLFGCAYALDNRLVLTVALVDAFVWLCGKTGSHPGDFFDSYVGGKIAFEDLRRFLAAAGIALGVAYAHTQAPNDKLRSFSRAYLHFGLLLANLMLWYLSIFGIYAPSREETFGGDANLDQRLLLTALAVGCSVTSLIAGGKLGQRALRGYGLTFLILDLFTFYILFVAEKSQDLWFIHLCVLGGALVGLGFFLEGKLRRQPSGE